MGLDLLGPVGKGVADKEGGAWWREAGALSRAYRELRRKSPAAGSPLQFPSLPLDLDQLSLDLNQLPFDLDQLPLELNPLPLLRCSSAICKFQKLAGLRFFEVLLFRM